MSVRHASARTRQDSVKVRDLCECEAGFYKDSSGLCQGESYVSVLDTLLQGLGMTMSR